jgi:fatty acid synthase subunit beta
VRRQCNFPTPIKAISTANEYQLRALYTLSSVLDALSTHRLPEITPTSDITQLIHTHLATALKLHAIDLDRGVATIPLKGIDIPFHSTRLRGEIDNYRQYLTEKLSRESIEPGQMIGKFIPNVMGKPFDVTKAYVQEVATVTGSSVLKRLVEGMA